MPEYKLSYTASQIDEKLGNIPTKTSQLTNDSGFKTTDNNTTYTLTQTDSTITLTGSDGKITSVTVSNTNNDCKIATGSYVGAGTDEYKSLSALQSNGRKITFPFAPRLVMIYSTNSDTTTFPAAISNYKCPKFVSTNFNIITNGKTDSFVSTVGAYTYYIMNMQDSIMYIAKHKDYVGSTEVSYGYDVAGTTYYWVAIG